MKVNKDLLLAAFIAVGIHIIALFTLDTVTTPVEYSVQKAPSSVEVTLVRRDKKVNKEEKRKKQPEVIKKVAKKEPDKPEKKNPEQEKKVEKEVAKRIIPEEKVVKKPEPSEKSSEKQVKEEKEKPETETDTIEKKKTEEKLEKLVQNVKNKKDPEPEPELTEKTGTPVQMPAYLNNKPPEYPSMARKRGFEGKVILRVRVLSSGNPEELEIKDSSGYDILDEAALRAVREWKFKPATRGGKPVDSWVEIPIRFELRDT